MRTMPASLVIEKNKVSSEYAWLVCVEINLLSGAVIRLVRNTEDIVIREDDYTKAGCVGHWKLNDDAASTAVTDYSPDGNDGVLNGGDNTEDLSAAGKLSTCLDFNGIDDCVIVPDSTALSPTTAVSVSAWIDPDTLAEDTGIVWKQSYNYLLWQQGGYIRFRCYDSTGSYSEALIPEASLAAGFDHVVGTFDGTKSRIYLNGVLVDTGDAVAGLRDQAGDLWIGKRTGGAHDFFDGKIDEVLIFNRALALKEIEHLYNSGAGAETLPVLYSAFPMIIDVNKQTAKGEIPSLKLQACNITRLIQPYLEAENGGIGAEVKITVVNSGYKNEDYGELYETFEVLESSANWEWVSFTLGAPNPLRRRFPRYRYYAGACRFRIRDGNDDVTVECGYTPETVADITLASLQPVSVECTAHGFITGDVVYFLSVAGTTELNGNNYTITKTDADNFTLNSTDGDDFTAYTSGGTVGYYVCPRTLEGCEDRGNLARYGGFYGMAVGGVRLV